MSLSRTWVSSLGEFSRQPLMLRLDLHVISLFCLHRALSKIHTWKLFVYGNIFAHGKINSGRKSLGEKKEKKAGPKKKERVPLFQVKNKILLWKRLVLTELRAGAQIRTKRTPPNQHLPYMMLKTKFPFFYASTSLDTKTLKIASNRNFESCMSIRCLVPQLCSFLIFAAGFSFAFDNFAHYCVVLHNAPLSNRDKKKKKKVCNGLLLPRNLDP